ncbi:MAG: DUF4185 domain-containing protein [Clostridia bacterium]|nr:DUF4185 domain-containing protein [Clostridia bacterium]
MYIKNVKVLGFLTGKNSKNDTLNRFDVGGTDLGMPLYNSKTDEMFIAFGDTFNAPFGPDDETIGFTGNWRSNVMAKVKLNDYKDGIEIVDFIKDEEGKARVITEAHHTAPEDLIEITKIPTGLIEVNGVLYMYYFSIRVWRPVPFMNYGGCVKSVDGGKTWSRVFDLTWVDETSEEFKEQTTKLINEELSTVPLKTEFKPVGKVDFDHHRGHYYTQSFPVDGKDGYIYLFGEGNYRKTGIKLARVLKENIEVFDEYEYMVDYDEFGKPIWVKGVEGINLQKKNVNSFILANPSGELTVFYNDYLKKWTLLKQSEDKTQALMYTADNIYGPYLKGEVIIQNGDKDVPNTILYAPLSHEKFLEEGGKIMNVIVSVWKPYYNPIVVKVEFK